MKNFMPNQSEKSSTYLTLARRPHQHRSALTPGGKLAFFIFFGLPAALIVLLLVFRSPIAAAVPLAFGAATVFASRGIGIWISLACAVGIIVAGLLEASEEL